VNKTEASLFESVHTSIKSEYAKQGSWEFVQDNPRLWHRLIRQALPKGENGERRNRPPPRDRQRPPKRRSGNSLQDDRRPLPSEFGSKPPPEQGEFYLRFSLFDADKNHLLGAPQKFKNITTKAINRDNVIIGYLGLETRKELSSANELQFSEQLNDTFGLIAFGTLIIVAGLAFPLANHFVKPIKKLKESTQVLASGHYEIRIKHQAKDELGELSRDFNLLAKPWKIMKMQGNVGLQIYRMN